MTSDGPTSFYAHSRLLSTLLLMIRRSDIVMQRMIVPKTPDPVSLLVMIVVGRAAAESMDSQDRDPSSQSERRWDAWSGEHWQNRQWGHS